MSMPFTPEQINSLSAQIDQQLQHLQQLRDEPPVAFRKGDEPDKHEITERAPAQWRAVAEITKEDPQTFWRRFRRAAHNDLCEEGGVLYAQWKKWGDLSSKAVLESFGAVLVAMGFSGNALYVLAVALGVIVMHLGCKAVCTEE
jgi:hypothetical protein